MPKVIALAGERAAALRLEMVVDDADYPAVSAHRWCPHPAKGGLWYAIRNLRRPDGVWQGTQAVHRFILNAPEGALVDHRDGTPLNNIRANLRMATSAENARNRRPLTGCTSPYKGVNRHAGKWQAVIRRDGKQRSLGHFVSEPDAAHAYNVAAVEVFGEFAWINEEVP